MIPPFTAFLSVFNGVVAFWLSVRNLHAYQKTGNEYSLMFSRVGAGVGFSLVFYGLPYIIVPNNPSVIGIFLILSNFSLLLGLQYALRFALKMWGLIGLGKITSFIIPFAAVVLVIFDFISLPQLSVRSGVIVTDVMRPNDYIFIFFILLLIIPPVIAFFTHPVNGRKAFIKKTVFGLAMLLGGLGGIGTFLSFSSLLPALLSHLLIFSAFLLFALMFFVLPFFFEEKEETTSKTILPPETGERVTDLK